MADYASNTPISRPIKLKDIVPTLDFNGIGFSPLIGWVFDVQDDMELFDNPPPGANG